MSDTVITLVMVVVLGPVADKYLVRPLRQRRANRHQARRRLRCAMRVVEGAQDGMHRWWWPYRTEVEPGGLRCRGRLVAVTGVADQYREPRLREWLVIDADLEIVRLTTPTAVLEMALTPADRAWITTALASVA